MSAGYASRLKEYPHKGVCGLPEQKETRRSYEIKRKELLSLLKNAQKVVVLTGAGISTAAGIPDFRGPRGIWTLEEKQRKLEGKSNKKRARNHDDNKDKDKDNNNNHPPQPTNMDFSHAQPTLTHRAIYYLMENDKDDNRLVHFCVTQNVDGLHRRSGLPRERLTILHGCVFTEKCEQCATERFCNQDVGGMSFARTKSESTCPSCQSPMRDTLLDWKDPLPEDDYERSIKQCQEADLVLCLGTSLRIEPAGSLPTLAKKFCIVNLQETPYDEQATLLLRAKVDQVLKDLMQDLGIDENIWNVPLSSEKIQRVWRNPDIDEEYASNWWKIETESANEEELG